MYGNDQSVKRDALNNMKIVRVCAFACLKSTAEEMQRLIDRAD
jgi:hypothetical protein